ncbi:hypothetical protein [Saccharospirillum salsuginis]|uniref:Uncharacterized protein n=1 Tax=Saccharospirillum salsuginis TaxID=418750 RepID=A0A918NJ39_9GAMM|nr:hypothetical protein [Saccharospirillum salsuginis]GGX71367.1 hypothetical protein GCM10007392_43580 [Saccharospirillum salsuginis]
MTDITSLIEPDFTVAGQLVGTRNETTIRLTRYQNKGTPDIRMGGEHISLVTDESGHLKGLAKLLVRSACEPGDLPSEEEAHRIATEFFNTHAPDLLEAIEVKWIKPHTEEITHNSKKHHLHGMKVKCKNQWNGQYFWAVVGPDKKVMVFERDVIWDFLKAGRQTEKWLHDHWLIKKNYTY